MLFSLKRTLSSLFVRLERSPGLRSSGITALKNAVSILMSGCKCCKTKEENDLKLVFFQLYKHVGLIGKGVVIMSGHDSQRPPTPGKHKTEDGERNSGNGRNSGSSRHSGSGKESSTHAERPISYEDIMRFYEVRINDIWVDSRGGSFVLKKADPFRILERVENALRRPFQEASVEQKTSEIGESERDKIGDRFCDLFLLACLLSSKLCVTSLRIFLGLQTSAPYFLCTRPTKIPQTSLNTTLDELVPVAGASRVRPRGAQGERVARRQPGR